ncbi:MAG TPA: HAD family hydrolase [Solirubrobacterales bacterium]|nr:HAD family hydrolase [Solirubrobacterales bacterium]
MTGKAEDGSVTLLHISDLQFGYRHRFGNLAAGDPDAEFDSLFGRLREDLTALADQGMRPEVIVVSGDLAEKGQLKEYEDAHEFLVRLCDTLALPRRRVVLVPGNHDVNWKLCEAYFLQEEASEGKPRVPYWPKWSPYAQMFDEFFSEHADITFTEEEPWSFWELSDLKLVVAGLNSTYLESHRKGDHFGHVGERQLRAIADRLGEYQKCGWFRLGVVHHNVSRGPVNDDENLRDAELLGELLGPSLNLLLHGHTHSSGMSWLGQEGLPVISTGSAALSAEARPGEVPNQFQLVRLEAGGLTRWTRSYAPERRRWIADPRSSQDGNDWRVKYEISFASTGATFNRSENGPEREPSSPEPDAPRADTTAVAAGDPAKWYMERLAAPRQTVFNEVSEALRNDGSGILITGPEGAGKTCLLEALLSRHRDDKDLNLVPVRLEGQTDPQQALGLALQFRFGGSFVPDGNAVLDSLPPALPSGTVLLVDNANTRNATDAVCWIREHFRAVPTVVTSRTGDTSQFPGFVPIKLGTIGERDAREILQEFELEAAITQEVIARAGGNPQALRQQAAAARAKSPTDREPIESMKWPRSARRSLWLIAMLPCSILSYELLEEVGGFDQTALDMIEDYAVGEAVLRGEYESRYLSVHPQLARFCRETVMPKVQPKDSNELIADAVSYYVRWLDGGPPVEAIDAAYDNLMYLLGNAQVADDLRADLAVALIGDSLDDPTGYMPSRGLVHMLREPDLRNLLEETAQEVGSLRAGPIFKNLGLFIYRANEVGAEYLLRKAKDAYDNVGDERGSASVDWLLGCAAEDSGNGEEAADLFRESRTNSTDPEIHALSYHFEGRAKYHWEDFEAARRSFEQVKTKMGEFKPDVQLKINRGLAYVKLAQAEDGDYEAVETELVELRNQAKKNSLPREAARCTRHIGKAQLARGDLEGATQSLESARADFRQLGDLRGLGATLCDLATALRRRKKYYEAATRAKESLDIARGKDDITFPMKSPIGVARAEIELAEIKRSNQSRDHIDDHLRRACNIFEGIGHPQAAIVAEQLGFARRDAPFQQVKGVVFDLVDTLAVVSPRAYEDAKKEISKRLGVDHALFKEAWARSRKKASREAKWSARERIKWVAEELKHELSNKALDDLAEKEAEIWTQSVTIDDSAIKTLRVLKENGLKVALVTNGSSAMLELPGRLKLKEHLDVSLLSCEVESLKPEAGIYEEAVKAIGLKAKDCMYVGDGSDRELEGAIAVGMFAVRMIGHRDQRPHYTNRDSLDWHATVTSLDELLVRMGLADPEELNDD